VFLQIGFKQKSYGDRFSFHLWAKRICSGKNDFFQRIKACLKQSNRIVYWIICQCKDDLAGTTKSTCKTHLCNWIRLVLIRTFSVWRIATIGQMQLIWCWFY